MTARKTTAESKEWGRVLERLDQQDRNSVLISTDLQRETIRAAEETKANSNRLSNEIIASGERLAGSLEKHSAEDTARFSEINRKLDVLIEAHASIKGAKAVIFVALTGVAAFIGWAISLYQK